MTAETLIDEGRAFRGDTDTVLMNTVVPDHTGAVVVGFYTSEAGVVKSWRSPVVAWCVVSTSYPYPVVIEELPDVWCLEVQGAWTFRDDYVSFDTYEEAVAHATKLLADVRAAEALKEANRQKAARARQAGVTA